MMTKEEKEAWIKSRNDARQEYAFALWETIVETTDLPSTVQNLLYWLECKASYEPNDDDLMQILSTSEEDFSRSLVHKKAHATRGVLERIMQDEAIVAYLEENNRALLNEIRETLGEACKS
jgi:hypothetical protein